MKFRNPIQVSASRNKQAKKGKRRLCDHNLVCHYPTDNEPAALDRQDARPVKCFADNLDFDARYDPQGCKTPLLSTPRTHADHSHPVSGRDP